MARIAPHRKLRVGGLAKATGLSIRTLHYYEEIGLLPVADRTPSGHRLYDDSAVERLYRISLLRRLGMSLRDIANALEDPSWTLRASIERHLLELDRRREAE